MPDGHFQSLKTNEAPTVNFVENVPAVKSHMSASKDLKASNSLLRKCFHVSMTKDQLMKLVFPQQRNKVMRILKSTSVLVLLNTGLYLHISFLALHIT